MAFTGFTKCGHKDLIITISIALQIARNLAIIWELARLFARGGCALEQES